MENPKCPRCGHVHAPDADIKIRGIYDCYSDEERKAHRDAIDRALAKWGKEHE